LPPGDPDSVSCHTRAIRMAAKPTSTAEASAHPHGLAARP